MNSCTLTSKQLKKNLLFSFALVIIAFVAVDLFLIFYSDLKTTKSTFIEDKSSKLKHFDLNKKLDRDIVFIGSSRTVYHISTKVFQNKGLEVYNFGVSGNFLVDYPAYIKKAIEQKPRIIVVSLPITTLFQEIREAKRPFLSDLTFYAGLKNRRLFYNSMYHWLKNIHAFLSYSEAIVVKLKLFYDKFEPETKNLKGIKEQARSNDAATDCSVFNRQEINSNKIVLKCTNGDGILLGNILSDLKHEKLEHINRDTLAILRKYVAMIKVVGIKPVIVFEPIYTNPYEYNKSEIKERLREEPYLDLTDLDLPPSDWADNGHLNIYGRRAYSEYLSEYFKKELL